MLTRQRLAPILVSVCAGLLLDAAPAFAGDGYGDVNCSQTPSPVCDLGVGTGGGTGSQGDGQGGQGPGRRLGHGHPGAHEPNQGDIVVGGDANLARCSYVKSDYRPPAGGVLTAAYEQQSPPASSAPVAPGRGPGAWYVWRCTEGVADGVYRPPVWIADGQAPGRAALPSPADLARAARKQLRLPSPVIAANPRAREQVVNLPTWMWVSNGWGPVSATASVPGVSVTATATPMSVTWSMGDGSTVTCPGAGTPFRVGGDPTASSPDCGHTYRTSSATQLEQVFPVAATVHWTVTWAGAGQGGTFPDLTTTGTAAFRVAEVQALNNGGG